MFTQYLFTNEQKKELWGEGPWLDEPDVAQWFEAQTQILCVIMRNTEMGALNGYVGVPPTHVYGGKDLKKDFIDDIPCGITFAGEMGPLRQGTYIYPENKYRKYWYIGFDCMHAGDHIPAFPFTKARGTYKDFTWVHAAVEALAQWMGQRAKEEIASES